MLPNNQNKMNADIRIVSDQLGRSISIPLHVERIVSLVPSQTELLYDLGLDEKVVGITKFCIHPETWFRTKTRVGGTKDFDVSKIIALNPDLIIANKEENEKEKLEELMSHFPVWISDIKNLEDALEMIQQIGFITNSERKSTEIISQINSSFENLKSTENSFKADLTVLYLIWQNPFISVGNDTFISDMLLRLGFKLADTSSIRYPEITLEQIKTLNPSIIMLSSEPFPFNSKHLHEFQELFPDTKILLVDGEYFSWYGSRLLNAASYFYTLKTELKKILD